MLKLLKESWTQCVEADDFPHAPVARMELICEALRCAEQPSQETLEQWLMVDCNRDVDWARDIEYFRAGSALMLLQQRGAVPPVDKVLRLFDLDWDWWNDLIAATLAASPSKVTLQEMLSAYPRLDWHAKLFVAGVFEHLRFPGMDLAVAGLAITEKEDDHRVRLAQAAVLYGTAAARGTCAEVAAEAPDDPERGPINDYL